MSSALLVGLHVPLQRLAWLGRHGTRARAALVSIGIAAAPPAARLNFALSRFPIYLTPHLLQPMARTKTA